MAQPIAQHPPSALQFPSASRTSSLGFGFASPAARSPFTNVSNANFGSPSSPFGSPSVNAQSHLALKARKVRPILATSQSAPRTLKRSRLSSSPSPPRTPSPGSSGGSPSINPKHQASSSKGDLAVNSLSISDVQQVRIKRSRQEQSKVFNEDLDLGLMLATLPPSTHLQILTSLISNDPSLRSKVLDVIPPPDLAICDGELYRLMEKVSRQYGDSGAGRHLLSWGRSESDIATFCRTAITYLTFFYTPQSNSPIGYPTQHNLLYMITKYAAALIRLLPPHVAQSPATSTLSQLVNTLISRWREWVSGVSSEVNEKGEMYPLSSVTSWIQNLSELADPTRNAAQACPDPAPTAEFTAAIESIRDSLVGQIGWLVGPSGGMR